MRRRNASLALASSCFVGIDAFAQLGNNSWVDDDGESELSTEYTVLHRDGQVHSDVYAAFTDTTRKKVVRLRNADGIEVNGQRLPGISSSQGYYYKDRIPVRGTRYQLALQRGSGASISHELEMPDLAILELPKIYQSFELLRISSSWSEPPEYVIADRYSLDIYSASSEFGLTALTYKADNRYQFDRLPKVENGQIVFRHITEAGLVPGQHLAILSRLHHVALGRLPGSNSLGWARLSRSRAFQIEVR